MSLLLEPYGELVDGLTQCMDADEHLSFFIDGAMPLASLREIMETQCQWALAVDYDEPTNCARFWYTSAEKLEPRVGERFDEPGAEYELPLAVGRDMRQRMHKRLLDRRGQDSYHCRVPAGASRTPPHGCGACKTWRSTPMPKSRTT